MKNKYKCSIECSTESEKQSYNQAQNNYLQYPVHSGATKKSSLDRSNPDPKTPRNERRVTVVTGPVEMRRESLQQSDLKSGVSLESFGNLYVGLDNDELGRPLCIPVVAEIKPSTFAIRVHASA